MRALRTRVKICGITGAEDARASVRAGADAVGVILTDATRQVSIEEAAEALALVPAFVGRVGVFVDAPEEFVAEAVARIGLTSVQFHGDESPEACASSPVPVVKAIRVAEEGFDPASLEPYRSVASALLLDTFVRGMNGGTGVPFAWGEMPPMPAWATIVVAGGLTPVNVHAAIAAMKPFAVDVSSGVEERRRHKDQMKLKAFMAAVRAADAEVRGL
jgi:phosphoribosylanthranilate isomerase